MQAKKSVWHIPLSLIELILNALAAFLLAAIERIVDNDNTHSWAQPFLKKKKIATSTEPITIFIFSDLHTVLIASFLPASFLSSQDHKVIYEHKITKYNYSDFFFNHMRFSVYVLKHLSLSTLWHLFVRHANQLGEIAILPLKLNGCWSTTVIVLCQPVKCQPWEVPAP